MHHMAEDLHMGAILKGAQRHDDHVLIITPARNEEVRLGADRVLEVLERVNAFLALFLHNETVTIQADSGLC